MRYTVKQAGNTHQVIDTRHDLVVAERENVATAQGIAEWFEAENAEPIYVTKRVA